jgi:signal transduction histidine kinase
MRSLQHAADLVSSFKQVAVDRASVQRRSFCLRNVVDEILLTLEPGLRRTTHKVVCRIPVGINMDSYPGPLGQVLSNLINNAVLHAFDGRQKGRIEISAEPEGANQVCIAVRDNGAGIKESHVARVFDPFFTTRLGQGGSGLGLSIVYSLVSDVLGGRIEVSSREGEGSCFTLTLPLVAPDERTVSDTTPAAAPSTTSPIAARRSP